MLRLLHAVSSGRDFWSHLALVVLSAVLQAAAVLVLFPVGGALFGGDPLSGPRGWRCCWG